MEIRRLSIPDVCIITLQCFEDSRGCFAELFNERLLADRFGLNLPFVQDNLSRSTSVNTVRALHFQRPPNAQGKLLRVVRGSIRDIAVDVRRASHTYGQHISIDLSEERLELLWIPPGFAHGFITTAPCTEVNFKTTAYYSPTDEVGIIWNDPDLQINWGVSGEEAILSERDSCLPPFSKLDSPF
ncbi:MAG: dTDP-4-dehydrorhamnose 3,5-epimerase [Gammaproteobacteria bacterium]|nr:dTDP-4-dehydrorhamnose 3,5-epimerase [Gammaproteobacteria bacterium]MBU1414166.1 dTDP-4-dehydrorhamnose 3,5-epimerase [Gammaproteobacteria bacterium]